MGQAVAGLRGTGDWGTDERPKDFRESILFYSPNGNAPLFALTSKAGKKSVSDPEYNWWAEGQNLVRLQVNGALAAGDTTVTVDSADPTASTMSALYGTAKHLKNGDLLLVEPSSDNATFDHELIMVQEVLSDTQFTVARGVGGTSAGSIGNDAYLLLIGSAYGEGTAAPDAVSRNPVKFNNYIQIFKDSYELTGTADKTTSRTGSAWSNDKKRKMFDHARAIEMSMLFGRPYETVDSNGKPIRYMGGLRYQIPAANTYVYSAAVTAATFADKIGPAYDFDLGGGDTRIGFCGNTALIELSKVIQATSGIALNTTAPVKQWGMDFQEFILPNGRLYLKSHPLMSQHAIYKKAMFICDFSAIKYVVQKGRPDGKVTDDVQNKDEDVRRGYIQTDCSLMVDGGGLSCAYLGNISAT